MTATWAPVEPTVTPARSDEELVDASRRGDTRAFGQIVRRYQALVSGLIYADCGDLHRSEDLAQETFLSAWKSLDRLRDAAKLPAWLCQIARHRLMDAARATTREAEQRRGRFSDLRLDPPSPSLRPVDDLLLAEESELLWRTLAQVPQPYRETLVLYYRQGRSTADVALATETTEVAVRQRLARGREMLREQVAAMVERNIARSAPTPAFADGVLAALPGAIGASAGGAGVAASAAKGSAAAAKGTALLALCALWLGAALGFLGAIVGTWINIRALPPGRMRWGAARFWLVFWIVILVAPVGYTMLFHHRHDRHWTDATFLSALAAFSCAYGMVLTGMVALAKWKVRMMPTQFREDYVARIAANRGGGDGYVSSLVQIAGAIGGGLCWMLSLPVRAHDALGSVLIALAIIGGTAFFARRLRRERRAGNIGWSTWPFDCFLFITAVIAVMLNGRMHAWLAAARQVPVEQVRLDSPMWGINVACAVFVGWLLLLRWTTSGSTR